MRGAARRESARRRGVFDRPSALPPRRQQASSPQCDACLCRAYAVRWHGPMRELEYEIWKTVRSDFAFLRTMGIAPCSNDRSPPQPSTGRPHIRLTDADAKARQVPVHAAFVARHARTTQARQGPEVRKRLRSKLRRMNSGVPPGPEGLAKTLLHARASQSEAYGGPTKATCSGQDKVGADGEGQRNEAARRN